MQFIEVKTTIYHGKLNCCGPGDLHAAFAVVGHEIAECGGRVCNFHPGPLVTPLSVGAPNRRRSSFLTSCHPPSDNYSFSAHCRVQRQSNGQWDTKCQRRFLNEFAPRSKATHKTKKSSMQPPLQTSACVSCFCRCRNAQRLAASVSRARNSFASLPETKFACHLEPRKAETQSENCCFLRLKGKNPIV